MEAPRRYRAGAYRLPDGGRRELYMHSEANARAAWAAIQRDPTLAHTIVADEYEDTPP